MSKSKGFTLIELLVVIAIIGILASIVLVSFPGATKKAKDSRVISAISQARTVMTYLYANDGDYDAFAVGHADMLVLAAEVASNSHDDTVLTVEKNTAKDKACMYAPLNVDDGASWYCADSSGVAGNTSLDPSALTRCDGITAVCPLLD